MTPDDLGLLAKDTEAVRAAVQRAVSTSFAVIDCALDRLRHVDDGGLVASYRVTLHHRISGRRTVEWYGGFAGGDDGALFVRCAAEAHSISLGPPVLHLAERRMVLFALPNDPQLPNLPGCFARDALDACLAAVPGLADGATEVACVPLKYDPGRGCTLRFDFETERGGGIERRTLIAKTRKGDRMAKVYDNMRRVSEGLPATSLEWSLARPLWYDPERMLMWEEAIQGRPFWSLVPGIDLERAFTRMARAAADIHRSGAARKGKELEQLPRGGDETLAAAFPDLGARHARLMEALETAAGSLPPAQVSLHGDFHPGQFVIDRDRVGLTDFDRSFWGDPGNDLGRFASHLYLHAVREGIDPKMFATPLEAFYAAYARHAPEWRGMAPVCWHVAAQLAGRRIHKFIDHVADDPRAKIEQMLSIAEAHVDRMRDA